MWCENMKLRERVNVASKIVPPCEVKNSKLVIKFRGEINTYKDMIKTFKLELEEKEYYMQDTTFKNQKMGNEFFKAENRAFKL